MELMDEIDWKDKALTAEARLNALLGRCRFLEETNLELVQKMQNSRMFQYVRRLEHLQEAAEQFLEDLKHSGSHADAYITFKMALESARAGK